MANSKTTDGDGTESDVRTHWSRTCWRTLNDPRTRREISELGRALIARWEHKTGDAAVEYYYEPDRQFPYRVTLDSINFDESLKTRSEGSTVNKELLRSPDIAEKLSIHRCGAETVDGEECAIQVDSPDSRCHLHSE